MKAKYQLRLLGHLSLEHDRQPLNGFESRKAVGLLAYLIVARKPVFRSHLADLFWPDKPERRGRGNLSRVLNNLSTLLPNSFQANRDTIEFQPVDTVWVDLYAFEAGLSDGGGRARFAALQLYRGDFLDGLFVNDSPDFELWLLTERERWRQRVIGLLERLIVDHLQGGDYPQAQDLTTRLLTLQPDVEAVHRQMMWLLAKNGQHQVALTQYENCRRFLADELNAAPSPETTALFKALQQGQVDQFGPHFLNHASPIPNIKNPYRGLHTFSEADASFFFGREATTDRLRSIIGQAPLVAVIGASGSGKSSLVNAGLLPWLRATGDWLITKFRPGDQPFHALASALTPLLPSGWLEAGHLAERLYQGGLALPIVIQQVQPSQRLLVFIDQFEELYTLCNESQRRLKFLDCLLSLNPHQHSVNREGLNDYSVPTCAVVLTMRADFMEQALNYRSFADILQANTFILGPMNRQELTAAIVKPAQQLGVSFEPGLVERILGDVGSEPGNLPLLEFALTTLWNQQAGGQLSHAAYQAIGGVEGALSHYADQVYEQLPPGEQKMLPRVMQQLVRPGTQTGDTRRAATRSEFTSASWQLIQKLADARLVVTNHDPAHGETAEIVHEALISHWQRLQDWVNADRAFRTWQGQLRVVVQQWRASDQSESGLLHGLGLELAEDWLARRKGDFSTLEHSFVQASIAHHSQEQARRLHQRRQITTGLVVGLIGAVILSILAIWGWWQAEIEQKVSLSHKLAAQSLNHLAMGHIDLALLLSLEANRVADTPEALSSLLSGLQHSPYRAILREHTQPVRQIALSPNGQLLASVDDEGMVFLWSLPDGQVLDQISPGQVQSLTFSANGELLAMGKVDGIIELWHVASRHIVGRLVGHTGSVKSITFSSNGQLLLSGGGDRNVMLWDVDGQQPVFEPLTGHLGQVESVSFSPDNQLMASGSVVYSRNGVDNRVFLWNAQTGQLKEKLFLNDNANASSVAFSPEGGLLAVGQTDGHISLWDSKSGQMLGQLVDLAHTNPTVPTVKSTIKLAFAPDGQILAAGDENGNLMLWDVGRQQILSTLIGHTGGIRDIDFTPDGNTLISAGADHHIILWNMTPLLYHTLARAPERIWSMAVSPDGDRLATGSDDGTVTLWDIQSGQIEDRLTSGYSGGLNDLSFSPDGQSLAVGSDDGYIAVWSLTPKEQDVRLFTGHIASVNSVAFSPDGQILASGSRDQTIILWDVASGHPLFPPLEGHTDGVWRVAFSPDGRTLASAGWDGTVRLWDALTGQSIRDPLTGHTDAVVSLAFSPDGQLLASGSRDQTIILWEVATGQPLGQPLEGHVDTVWDVTFSPQGELLASAGCGQPDTFLYCKQGEVRLWHMPDGRLLGQPMAGHTGVVWRVSFSPDGHTLISAGDDARIISWNVNPQSWQTLACNITRRNLTAREWQLYLGGEPFRTTCDFLTISPTLPARKPPDLITSKEGCVPDSGNPGGRGECLPDSLISNSP